MVWPPRALKNDTTARGVSYVKILCDYQSIAAHKSKRRRMVGPFYCVNVSMPGKEQYLAIVHDCFVKTPKLIDKFLQEVVQSIHVDRQSARRP